MKKDLHIHTIYSDGEDDERQIIEKIKEAGINEFAITDHDTLKGSELVYELVKDDSNFIFHSGVELSCRVNEFKSGVNVHMLYYDFDYNEPTLRKIIDKISQLRLEKIEIMKELVKEIYNIEIKEEDLKKELAKTNTVGKPHFYRLLCKYGDYSKKIYYKNMSSLKDAEYKLDAFKVIEDLKDCKGYLVLAHPGEVKEKYNLTDEEIESLIKLLKENGLDGIETKTSKHTEIESANYSLIATKYNLIETSGSDYHGKGVKPDVDLGVCYKREDTSI